MAQRITSTRNQLVKETLRLRDRRGRQRQGRTIIDGAREILRAIDAGIEIVELFFEEQRTLVAEALQVWERATGCRAPMHPVSTRVFDKLAYGDRNDGVLAVARVPQLRLADLSLPDRPLIAVLESVEKPGNIGAVLRCADATGVSAVIVAGAATDLYNPNTIRASVGTIFSIPMALATVDEARRWLADQGPRIVAARVEAATRYSEVCYRDATAFVLGSEAHGLSDAWRGEEISPVSLPMLGIADSLNVSVTAAVLFYEALRQRSAAAE